MISSTALTLVATCIQCGLFTDMKRNNDVSCMTHMPWNCLGCTCVHASFLLCPDYIPSPAYYYDIWLVHPLHPYISDAASTAILTLGVVSSECCIIRKYPFKARDVQLSSERTMELDIDGGESEEHP